MEYHGTPTGNLFKPLASAWSARKLEISLRGLCGAWIVYVLFTYFALMLGPFRSEGLGELFRYFEFFPWLPAEGMTVAGGIIWVVGIIVAVCIILDAALAVAIVAVEDGAGNTSFMITDALRFARTHRWLLFVTLGFLAVIAGVFCIGLVIAATLVRIPVCGEFICGVGAIPIFVWAMIGIISFCTFLFGLNTIPAIIAKGAVDVLETVVEAFAVVWSRPIRFFALQIGARMLVLVAVTMFALLFVASFITVGMVFSLISDQKVHEMFTVALYRVPYIMESELSVRLIHTLNSYLGTPMIVDTMESHVAVKIAGWLLGTSFLVTCLAIIAYGFSVFWTAQVFIIDLVRWGFSKKKR